MDNKIKKELAVKHNPEKAVNSFLVDSITQATSYTVTIKSVCVFETLKTISDEELLSFCTLPEPPTNLSLDSRSPNSMTIKWDSPSAAQANQKYKLSVESESIGYNYWRQECVCLSIYI